MLCTVGVASGSPLSAGDGSTVHDEEMPNLYVGASWSLFTREGCVFVHHLGTRFYFWKSNSSSRVVVITSHRKVCCSSILFDICCQMDVNGRLRDRYVYIHDVMKLSIKGSSGNFRSK